MRSYFAERKYKSEWYSLKAVQFWNGDQLEMQADNCSVSFRQLLKDESSCCAQQSISEELFFYSICMTSIWGSCHHNVLGDVKQVQDFINRMKQIPYLINKLRSNFWSKFLLYNNMPVLNNSFALSL